MEKGSEQETDSKQEHDSVHENDSVQENESVQEADTKQEKDLEQDSDVADGEFDLLAYIGQNGVYQVTLFLLLGTMEYFGVDSLTINFTAGDQDHWCRVEPLMQSFSPDVYSQCSQFNENWNSYTEEQFEQWVRNNSVSSRDCDNGWVYDQSEFVKTITGRWDLVCDDAWLVSMVSTIYMAGRLVGALTCGFVSDGLGRRVGILVFTIVRLLGALISLYADSYGVFVTGRFIVAAGSTGANLCAYVLISEVIGSKYRARYGALWQCIFSLGYAILSFYAFFVRDDQYLQSVLTWPILIFFLIIFLAHESPRWLIVKKKEKQAEDVIRFIADVNRIDIPDKIDFSPLHDNMEKQTEAEESQKNATFLDLFRYPNMRKKTLIVWFNWFCNSLVYYGLGLNAGSLPGSVYVTTFFYGISEIPANLFGIYLMNKIGRKWTILYSLLFGAACSFICVALILIETDPAWLTTFAVLGKMGIAISFTTAYVYSVEIFPTPLRNVGIGSSSMCARISGMIAPFMGDPLIEIWAPLPSMIFGIFALLSGLLMFLVPETLNKRLPTTIEEAEAFGKKTTEVMLSTTIDEPTKNGLHVEDGVLNNGTVNGTVTGEKANSIKMRPFTPNSNKIHPQDSA